MPILANARYERFAQIVADGKLTPTAVRDGSVIPFRPRPQQLEVLDMIYRRGWKRLIILKCQQIGFSTLLGVMCCDRLCFMTGQQISLVDTPAGSARPALPACCAK